jgi:hypothetical protein
MTAPRPFAESGLALASVDWTEVPAEFTAATL